MFKNCEFEGKCTNENVDCNICIYNLDASLDHFEWNGKDKEPTQKELYDAIPSK